MICKCGGWTYATVAKIDGRDRVALKCTACNGVQRISREGNGTGGFAEVAKDP